MYVKSDSPMTFYQLLHRCLVMDARQTGPPPERVMKAALRAVKSNNES